MVVVSYTLVSHPPTLQPPLICDFSTWYILSRNSLPVPNLILEPVEPGPDGHGLDVPPLVHAVVVAAWLSQRLVQPPLQLLQPRY